MTRDNEFKTAYPLGAHGRETDHSNQDSVCEPTKYGTHARRTRRRFPRMGGV